MKKAPRWERRKADRPDEIIKAARGVFADSGFASAKLQDVARRAGVAKASIYVYFETKEALFRAVVRSLLAPDLESVRTAAEGFTGKFDELLPMILLGIARAMQTGQLPVMAKIVIGESRTFPDLARIWHDDLLSQIFDALVGIIRRAQARKEVRPGDPRLYVFSIVGPMVTAMLYRSVFQGITKQAPDLQALAVQHAHALLFGMRIQSARRKT